VTEFAGWFTGSIHCGAGLAIDDMCMPADFACGNYGGFVELDDRHIMVTIADACGHGYQAALILEAATATTAGQELDYISPAHELSQTSRLLIERQALSAGQFITAAVLCIDLKTLACRFAVAGHPHPVLLRDGHPEVIACEGGLPLGIEADIGATDCSVQFRPGDTCILYTDGVSEARLPGGGLVEAPRAIRLLASAANELDPASAMRQRLDELNPGNWQDDDTTATFLRFDDTPH